MSWLNKILGSSVKETLSTVFDGIDKISTTKEEKATLRSQALQHIIADKQDARSMYKSDSSLQKMFAIFFLVFWFALTVFLILVIFKSGVKLDEWKIAFLSSIWGGLSSKLNTIVDFLFGGSHNPMDITKK